MMKRLTWFVSGVAAGAGAVVLVGRRIRRRIVDLTPVRVAERAIDRTRGSVTRLRAAVSEGRQAMSEREVQLKSRILGVGTQELPEQVSSTPPQ